MIDRRLALPPDDGSFQVSRGASAVRLLEQVISRGALGLIMIQWMSAPALAQAWVPPAGTGFVDIAVQVIDNTGHRLTDGKLLPEGQSVTRAVYLSGTYALTNRLSVSVGLPYVFAKYTGTAPPATLPVDLCRCWNSGWQDVDVAARVNLMNGLFALTPWAGVVHPSRAYNYQGEAVVGRHLNELQFGVAVGRRLDELSPRLSIQANYSYAVVQRVLDLPNNRSIFTTEGGLEVVPRRLFTRGLFAWQRTHGGLRAGNGPPVVAGDFVVSGEIDTRERFDQHDRLLRDNNFRAGIGASYSLPRAEIYLLYLHYVSGTNTHAGHALTLGMSVPFRMGGGAP
jgi:hypothetical protein